MSGSTTGAAWVAAWAAVGTGLLTVALAAAALRQVRQAQRAYEEDSRPYVMVDFDFSSVIVYLTIKNIGKTIARDVRITFDQRLTTTLNHPADLNNLAVFREPIPLMAPGRSMRLLFDSFPARANRDDLPMAYTVQLGYSDSTGRKYDDPSYRLDLMAYADTLTPPKGMDELVDAVEKLQKEVGKWTERGRAVRVATTNADQRDRRELRRAVRRMARTSSQLDGWRGWIRSYTVHWRNQARRTWGG